MYFFGALITTGQVQSTSIPLEQRLTSLQPISQKLTCNSHQNNLDGQITLQVGGKICISDFGVNCSFKEWNSLPADLKLAQHFVLLNITNKLSFQSSIFSNEHTIFVQYVYVYVCIDVSFYKHIFAVLFCTAL